MTTDTRHRLKLATERLSHLEEELASAVHHAIAGDAEASAERLRLLDEIEAQKARIRDLEVCL
jgi:hypothetical protein